MVTILALIFYAYLAAVASPQENLEALPIALVMLFYNGTLDSASLEGGWRDSLWFLGGRERSEAAGLEDAVWIIVAYLGGAAALGHVISLVRDLATPRGRRQIRNPSEGATG